MHRGTFSHRVRRTPSTESRPVVRCAICNAPGVDATREPAARLGLKPVEITGSVYVGPRADSPVESFDKEVVVQHQSGTCWFCNGERYLDGHRGSGLRIP
jgi:hypothetical protein